MELPGNPKSLLPPASISDMQLVESIPIPAFICDAGGGKVLCYNRLAVGMWGYEPGKSQSPLSTLTGNFLFQPGGSQLPRSEYPILKALTSGALVKNREVILQMPGGARVPVLVSASPLFDDAGKIRGALACFSDLTDLRRAQALARKSESDLLQTTEYFGVALWEYDPVTGASQHPSGFWQRMGFPPGQVPGSPEAWKAMVHPEDHDLAIQAATEAVRTGGTYRIEYRVLPPDGVPRWIRSFGRAVVNERGETSRMVVMSSDVSEEKRLEAGLLSSEERFRELADTVPNIVFTLRPDGTNDYLNQRFRELTGSHNAEITGEGWKPFLHPEDAAAAFAYRSESIRKGIAYSHQYRLRMENGDYHWFLFRVRPVQDSDGRLVRWVGTGMDIDDLKAGEERRRQAQKLESVGLLAAGVAHDFNNLLTGIIGSAGLLDSRLADSDPNRELLHVILNSGERAADLTRQLLAYAGEGRSTAQPMNLAAKVGETTDLVRASVSKKIRVLNELDTDLPLILGDAVQLRQLVLNLVLNAAEAIGDEIGRVIVRVAAEEIASPRGSAFAGGITPPEGRYVVLTVIDSGCGMDAHVQARMFDPFFTTKFLGRGLGLAAAQGIVSAHGGAIQVDSHPGRGTSIRVLFPESTAEAAPEVPSPGAQTTSVGRILLVDDEEVVLMVAMSALRDQGFGVVVARDGKDAVARFEHLAGEIDGVVLDLTMPVMGGEETLERIRKIRPDVPVLACSGFGEESVERLKHRGISGFLPKPYRPAVLVERVRQMLEVHRNSGGKAPGA